MTEVKGSINGMDPTRSGYITKMGTFPKRSEDHITLPCLIQCGGNHDLTGFMVAGDLRDQLLCRLASGSGTAGSTVRISGWRNFISVVCCRRW